MVLYSENFNKQTNNVIANVGGQISDNSSRKVNMDPFQIAQVLHTPPTTATAICLLSTHRLTQILHRVAEQNC